MYEVEELGTGIYQGVLVEDVVDTIKRVNQLYANVWIEDFYDKNRNYPLTKLPDYSMCCDLKKDDKVLVKFLHNDLTQPIIHKILEPDFSNIDDDTLGFIQFNKDKRIISKEDEISIVVKGSTITIKDNNITINADNVNITSDKCMINNHLEVLK